VARIEKRVDAGIYVPISGRAVTMNVPAVRQPVGLRSALSVAKVVESVLDPVVIMLWLIALAASLRMSLDARVVTSVVVVFALTFPGNVRLTDSPIAVLRKCLMSTLTVLIGLSLLAVASGGLELDSADRLLPWIAALPVVLFGAHLLTRIALPRLFARSRAETTVVVCGVNEIGSALAAQFRINPYHGVNFIGFFDDRKRERMKELGDQELLGSFDDLGNYVRENRVDRIYLALPMASQPRIVKMLEDLKDSTASIYFVPDIFVTDVINGRFESVAGMPVVAVRDTPFASVINSAVKRLEDIVLSGIALTLISPILAVIAISVRLSSPGPVLFRQRRYGLDGQDIVVYKFRTMTVAEDGDQAFTPVQKGDARVTRLGQILRRTSLDELPQLINVLQGRMSLVGPRPHVKAMNEQFRKLIPGYMLRHKIKPGITGLAQVRGFRGGDDLDEMTKRISSDLEYLRNWTLSLDLAIMARTVLLFLGDRKAY
jgi:putative colanic acid biosynthesis UDP-glucose lipid carrier transferase